jgi:hypothetical protein
MDEDDEEEVAEKQARRAHVENIEEQLRAIQQPLRSSLPQWSRTSLW